MSMCVNKLILHSHMEGGILEVLLVNAEGIRHKNLVGKRAYYVIIQCGTQVHRSKVSTGKDDQAWWNQKFKFEFPLSDWKSLTHLKLRIMGKEFFTESGFVGDTIIHLGGIVTEGYDKGHMEVKPAPYNVVLEDDTYKGQIKIGFKFLTKKEVCIGVKEFIAQENEPRQSICRSIINLWKNSWWRFLLHCNQTNSKIKQKEN